MGFQRSLFTRFLVSDQARPADTGRDFLLLTYNPAAKAIVLTRLTSA